MHRAGRAISQAPRVIGMRVGEHDRRRANTFQFAQPIKAAIDHHIRTAIGNQKRCVHAMPSCPRFDFAARAEERQFHQESLAFFSQSLAIYLLSSARQNFGSPLKSLGRGKKNSRRHSNVEVNSTRREIGDTQSRSTGTFRPALMKALAQRRRNAVHSTKRAGRLLKTSPSTGCFLLR